MDVNIAAFREVARGSAQSRLEEMEDAPEAWEGLPNVDFILEAEDALNRVTTQEEMAAWLAQYGDAVSLDMAQVSELC